MGIQCNKFEFTGHVAIQCHFGQILTRFGQKSNVEVGCETGVLKLKGIRSKLSPAISSLQKSNNASNAYLDLLMIN